MGITEGSNITVESASCTAWNATIVSNYCRRYGKVAYVYCDGTYSGGDIPKDISLFSIPWGMDRDSDTHLRFELILRTADTNVSGNRPMIVDAEYNSQYNTILSKESITGYVEFSFKMVYITK